MSRPYALVAGAVAMALALTLTGCNAYPTAALTTDALRQVGFNPVTVTSGRTVTVRVGTPTAEEGQTITAAGVVWTTLPFRFDRLDVTVSAPTGPAHQSFSRAQLEKLFAPRDPALDRRRYSRGAGAAAVDLLGREALPALVLVAGVAFVLYAGRPRPRAPERAQPRPPRR